jgi:hypothetical protein
VFAASAISTTVIRIRHGDIHFAFAAAAGHGSPGTATACLLVTCDAARISVPEYQHSNVNNNRVPMPWLSVRCVGILACDSAWHSGCALECTTIQDTHNDYVLLLSLLLSLLLRSRGGRHLRGPCLVVCLVILRPCRCSRRLPCLDLYRPLFAGLTDHSFLVGVCHDAFEPVMHSLRAHGSWRDRSHLCR